MKAADAMPVVTCLLALVFSASSWLVLRRFGRRALWKAAAAEAVLAMAILWSVGWVATSESPLIVSVLMVAAGIGGITATLGALAHRRAILSIPSASVAGVAGTYAGIIVAYVAVVYTM